MGRLQWTVRFLLRCFRHSNHRYLHHFGWHCYAKSPEQVADELVGFTYDA